MDWEVGNRVQIENADGTFKVGEITAVNTEEVQVRINDWRNGKDTFRPEIQIKSVDVKWDDGEEQKGIGKWDVSQEDSEVERSFRLAIEDAHKRIFEKMATARAALQEAVKISEETGIPFRAGVSPLSQSYIPNSLGDKFPDIDRSFVHDIAEAYGEYDGWQHSAVC